MKGSPEVIDVLQKGLPLEAHLNIQARQYQRIVKYQGLKKIAKHIKSMGDNAHYFQKCLTKRLLFFGADVGFAMDAVLDNKQSLTEILKDILELNLGIVGPYEKAIQVCMKAYDDASRNLFEHLLKWHQKDMAYLEQQLALIESLGEAEYIAAKLG